MSNVQHLEVFAAEDRTLTLYARDPSNQPVNLTSKTVAWRVGRSPRNLDSAWPIFSKIGTVTDASGGVFTVTIAAADTEWLEGDYQHQGETTDGSDLVAIVVTGRFRVVPVIED
jgi:hypothetical protein